MARKPLSSPVVSPMSLALSVRRPSHGGGACFQERPSAESHGRATVSASVRFEMARRHSSYLGWVPRKGDRGVGVLLPAEPCGRLCVLPRAWPRLSREPASAESRARLGHCRGSTAAVAQSHGTRGTVPALAHPVLKATPGANQNKSTPANTTLVVREQLHILVL